METNRRHCKVCGELKTRVTSDKYPNGRDKKHVDEHGKLWSGNSCPDCHKKNVLAMKKRKRIEKMG